METQKLCECGCGKPTKLAPRSFKRLGWIKGYPIKFINGHNKNWKGGKTISSNGYNLIKKPEHPRAYINGYVPEHLLIAEKILGKPFPIQAEIHHFPKISNFTNIVICENHRYHMLLHVKYRALKNSGNANYRKCHFCKNHDDPSNLVIIEKGSKIFHPHCHNSYQKKLYHSKSPDFLGTTI